MKCRNVGVVIRRVDQEMGSREELEGSEDSGMTGEEAEDPGRCWSRFGGDG
jgi:hypothetical protein